MGTFIFLQTTFINPPTDRPFVTIQNFHFLKFPLVLYTHGDTIWTVLVASCTTIQIHSNGFRGSIDSPLRSIQTRLYTSQKRKRNSWCQLTHCNLHCCLSFVSTGLLWSSASQVRCSQTISNSLVTNSILMQTRSHSCRLTRVSPANCGCVHIVLPINGSGRHACFKYSNCTSTVENRVVASL